VSWRIMLLAVFEPELLNVQFFVFDLSVFCLEDN